MLQESVRPQGGLQCEEVGRRRRHTDLEDDPERPRRVGEDHEECPFHPCAARNNMGCSRRVRGEGTVMVDWAHRRAGVQGDDQDPGEAERHPGELRYA